jgi:hypothetical protein
MTSGAQYREGRFVEIDWGLPRFSSELLGVLLRSHAFWALS